MISAILCIPFQDSKSRSTFTCLYVFVVFFVCLLESENVGNLYPYGKQQSDEEFNSFAYYGYMCLEIKVQPYGLRFFGARHYKLHVGV